MFDWFLSALFNYYLTISIAGIAGFLIGFGVRDLLFTKPHQEPRPEAMGQGEREAEEIILEKL